MGSGDGRLPGMERHETEALAPSSGLAPAAATAPLLDQRNEVRYAEIPCRTVLNRCQSERVPFEWSINPYRGCEFRCAYCYARYTHELMELEDWLVVERKIFVKVG